MNKVRYFFCILLRFFIHLPNKLFFPIKVKINDINSEFKKKGFYHIKENNEVSEILHEIEKNLLNINLQEIIDSHIKIDQKKYSINVYKYLDNEVKIKLENYFSNKKNMEFVNNLTMTKLKLRKIILLINFYNERTIEDDGPKMFHRDSDTLQDQLKVFILINNIDKRNGMFYFISKEIIDQYSAINPTSKRERMDINNKWRIENDQMDIASKKNIKQLYGEKGETLYIDTTNVYHKGGYINDKEKYRILLNPIYTPVLSLSDWNLNESWLLKFLQRKLTALKYRTLKKYNF